MSTNHQDRARVFQEVYDHNGWGAAPDGRPFYSDSPAELTGPIRELVANFIRDHEVHTVIDLCCGDFELASGISMSGSEYIGIDIYPRLIQWNRERFAAPHRSFHVADVVEHDLPNGDFCMIHMALYMLSNADVLRVLPKLKKYRYVVITDGQPDVPAARRRNIDKPTNKHTRHDYYGTGFYLELPPFNLDLQVLLEYKLPSGELLRTILLDHSDVAVP